MADVQIYTWSHCPYCVRAINLLNSKGIPFEEIDLDGKDDEVQALRRRTQFRTIPQIFIKGEFIGGFQELAALNSRGELDRRLAK